MAAVVYSGLAVFAFWNLWTSPSPVHQAGAGGDPSQGMWFMSYWPWALLHGHQPLSTVVANAPYGANLMDTTSVAFPSLLVMPVTLLFGPVTAYDTAMTLAVASSGVACYALLRRFVDWWPAALAGGLVFELSGYLVGQASVHLHLTFVALPLLIGLVVAELIQPRRSWRPEVLGLILAGLIVAQYFSSSELVLTTALVVALTLLAVAASAWVAHRPLRPTAGRVLRAGGVAGAVSMVVLAYPIWWIGHGAQATNGIPGGARDFGADLAALIVPSPMQVIAPPWAVHVASHFLDNGLGENGTYLGLPLVLLCAAGAVWLWPRPVVKVASVMMAVSLVLALGPSLTWDGPTDLPGYGRGAWLPERLLYHLPFGSQIKTVRFGLFTAVFAGLLLAVVLDELRSVLATRRSGRLRIPSLRGATPAAVAAVCLLPLAPSWPYATDATPVPAFFTTTAVNTIPPGSTVLLYPFPTFADASAAAMVWQAESFMRFRIVGGYFNVDDGRGAVFFNRVSSTYTSLQAMYLDSPRALTPPVRSAMDAELRSWEVTTVVADPEGAAGARGVAFLTDLIGRPPTAVAGAEVWYAVSWP